MIITKKYNNVVGLYEIDSGKKGPTVTIFSGIHGDEISGIKAAKRLLKELKSGKIKILKGRLLLLVGANGKAINSNKRYINNNLNRLFIDELNGEGYEYYRSRELKEILKKSDFLLDLHSTSGPSVPFIMVENEYFDYAKKLGIPTIVSGWGELGSTSVSGDTENYINSAGGIGFTLESGDHLSPNGTRNAYQISLNYLSSLDLIEKKYFKELQGQKNFLKMISVYVCESGNFQFKLDNLDNFQKVPKNTLIGIDGEKEIIASEDMILVMPNLAKPKKGEDVFFVGKSL